MLRTSGGHTSAPQENLPLEAWQKFQWALAHLARVEEAVTDFLESRPYRAAVHREAGGLEYVACLEALAAPPPEITLGVGDFLHNARSCLDYLVWDLSSAAHSAMTAGELGRLQFPITDSATKFQQVAPTQLRGVPAGARDLIEAVQPYSSSDRDHLWPLKELGDLTNIDKHRTLHVIAVYVGVASITTPLGVDPPEARIPCQALQPGAEILRYVYNVDPGLPEDSLQVEFSVAIDGGVRSWSLNLVGLLRLIAQCVDWDILEKFRR